MKSGINAFAGKHKTGLCVLAAAVIVGDSLRNHFTDLAFWGVVRTELEAEEEFLQQTMQAAVNAAVEKRKAKEQRKSS